jgi:hypothetical protein
MHELSHQTSLACSAERQLGRCDVPDVAQRILARKGLGDQRVLSVCGSPSMPDAEATIKLAKLGIYDATD